MNGAGRLGAPPRRVLEDAFRASVVNKLPPGDQPLLHRHLAPGAEPVWEVALENRGVRLNWGGSRHGRHCHRGERSLSTDRPGSGYQLKLFFSVGCLIQNKTWYIF